MTLGDERSWWDLDAEAVYAALDAPPTGLDASQAAERLARVGPNRLRAPRRAHPLAILAHQFTSPLIYVLAAAAAVSLSLGDLKDAAFICGVLVINAIMLMLAVAFVDGFEGDGFSAAMWGSVAFAVMNFFAGMMLG